MFPTTPGHLPHTMKLTGGTLFVDHCSKFIFIRSQVSLGAGETLVGKHDFETLLHSFGLSALSYHGNGIFASQAFKDNCSAKGSDN